jgi:hypothetical protein
VNNIVLLKMQLTSDYQPLASGRLVASVTISCPPGNLREMWIKADGGDPVPFLPGEWHEFRSVDLHAIEVRGEPGDMVTVVGGTW